MVGRNKRATECFTKRYWCSFRTPLWAKLTGIGSFSLRALERPGWHPFLGLFVKMFLAAVETANGACPVAMLGLGGDLTSAFRFKLWKVQCML